MLIGGQLLLPFLPFPVRRERAGVRVILSAESPVSIIAARQ